jgi:hypothetical protein
MAFKNLCAQYGVKNRTLAFEWLVKDAVLKKRLPVPHPEDAPPQENVKS